MPYRQNIKKVLCDQGNCHKKKKTIPKNNVQKGVVKGE